MAMRQGLMNRDAMATTKSKARKAFDDQYAETL
jgi:hypothetical protein